MNPPHLSFHDWVSNTKTLLDVEWHEENQVAVSELDSVSSKELERRGVSLSKLQVETVRTGLYGKTTVVFSKFGSHGGTTSLLPANNFSSGDIVRVIAQDQASAAKQDRSQQLSGVVSKVDDTCVSVAFGDDVQEADAIAELRKHNGPLRLDRLPNDATHKRLLRALDDLGKQKPGKRSTHLAQVLFGELLPRQDAVYITGPLGNVDKTTLDQLSINPDMNPSQRSSIDLALRSQDVSLIHGPPGTGKTTAVVELIAKAVELGNRVLVCAPSNIAVDNIVVRLASLAKPAKSAARNSIKMVRVGHPARLLPEVLDHSLDALIHRSEEKGLVNDARKEMEQILQTLYGDRKAKKSKKAGARVDWKSQKAELKLLRKEIKQRERAATKQLLNKCNVVLCTNVGAAGLYRHMGNSAANAGVPDEALFDLVVIDEAAQAIEASCWIPIMLGKRVVLAGDHKQLPPTIKSEKAAREGLGLTLFDRIMQLYGDSVSTLLDTQYRMHRNIMNWSSQEMYHSKLLAHDSVADRLLGDLQHVAMPQSESEWDEEGDFVSSTLVLVDTAGCDLEETEDESHNDTAGSRSNDGEAQLVVEHIERLMKIGLKQEEVAVITPYNAQVHLIKTLIRERYPKVEVRSVDGFQGQEKEAIVLSLVRSNRKKLVGFLGDERRLNVAITRAKRHVCLVCDSDTIRSNAFLGRMVDYFEEHAFIHYPLGETTKLANQSYTAHVTKPKTRAPPPRPPPKVISAEREAELQSRVVAFAESSETELNFPATLCAGERRVVHEECERLGLVHVSAGEGLERYLCVRKQDSAAAGNCDQTVDPEPSPSGYAENQAIAQRTPDVVVVENDRTASAEGATDMKNDGTIPTEDGAASKDDPIASTEDGQDTTDANASASGDDNRAANMFQGLDSSDSDSDDNYGDSPSHEAANEAANEAAVPKSIQDIRAIQRARYLESKQKTAVTKPGSQHAAEWTETTTTAKPKSKSKARKKKKKKTQAGNSNTGASNTMDMILADAGEKAPAPVVDEFGDLIEVDEEMALLDSLLQVKGKCQFAQDGKKCSTSTKVMGMDCRHCKLRFCFSHGQPEIHGCNRGASADARSRHRAEASAASASYKPLKGDKKKYLQQQLSKTIKANEADRQTQHAKETRSAGGGASKKKKKKKKK